MRLRIAWLVAAAACSHDGSPSIDSGVSRDANGSPDAVRGDAALVDAGATVDAAPPCTNLQCQARIDDCSAQGKSPTTITGKVYDPAGVLPLYDVYVYIPNSTPDPIVAGSPTCTPCEAPASGNPVIGALTDANGVFTLAKGPNDPWGVPSGVSIPLVLQIGKWRRQLTIPVVNACEANALPDPANPASKLRLPSKSSEGDMPLIAFTSGCDAAECFLRRIGIDDSEFVPPGSPAGHVQFFTGQDSNSSSLGNASSVAGGNTWEDTYLWWSRLADLQKYDIVFNSCECSAFDRNANAAGNDAYAAMHDYVNGGGRVFSTHYQANWFAPPTGPTDFQGVADWMLDGSNLFSTFFIDTSFPWGQAFADWLQANGVTPTKGQISLYDTRNDVNAVTSEASRWMYNADGATDTTYATMFMTFDAPVAAPPGTQCGRVAYSDVHLAGTSDDSEFPNECLNADPSGAYATNEQALEFLFFELSSCVQDDTLPPVPPPTN